MTHVLIAGLSSRAIANSAVGAGFAVTAIDAFADFDLHPSVRGLSVRRDFGTSFSPQAVVRAAADLVVEAVVYGSNFENHPDAVALLAAGRALWGNPPAVLRRVRDPRQLADLFREQGVPAPTIWINDLNDPNVPNVQNDWLVKPVSSGGGRGVRRWTGHDLPRGCYLQQRIEGLPASLVFVGAGGHSVPLGVSRQLAGDPAFGADGFTYCGNILAGAGDPQFNGHDAVMNSAFALARMVVRKFGLVGVNGIDFVVADGVPYPIEVNPRWCASMELVERAFGASVFGVHAAACASGTLPAFDLQARQGTRAVGKAVVFARRDVTLGDTRSWLDDPTVGDVPHPGEHIAGGHPICTVLAEGRDAAECYDALVQRAERVYSLFDSP